MSYLHNYLGKQYHIETEKDKEREKFFKALKRHERKTQRKRGKNE